jgi:hypothetical protein
MKLASRRSQANRIRLLGGQVRPEPSSQRGRSTPTPQPTQEQHNDEGVVVQPTAPQRRRHGVKEENPMRTARSGTAMRRGTSNGDRLTKCAGRRKPHKPSQPRRPHPRPQSHKVAAQTLRLSSGLCCNRYSCEPFRSIEMHSSERRVAGPRKSLVSHCTPLWTAST